MENNNDIQLIKIEAVVREEMFVDVKKALTDIGVNGITAYQVVGCGIQRGMSEYVRGQKVDVQVLPKIKFEIVVSSEEWERKTIEAIQKAAFTGEVGDGKIFSYEEKQPLRATRVTVKYLPTILNRRLKSVLEKQATMQFRLPTLTTDIFLFSYIKKSAYRNLVRTFCLLNCLSSYCNIFRADSIVTKPVVIIGI